MVFKKMKQKAGKCAQCGWHEVPEVLHVHHLRPREYGGGDEPENLIVLCPNCHAVAHKILRESSKRAIITGEVG